MCAFKKFGGDRGGDRGGRGFGGGGGGFGGPRRSFGGGGRSFGGPRQMHQATCSKCGQDCEVPFKPTGERPVFCSNCFKSQGGDTAPRFSSRGSLTQRDSFGGGNTVAAGGVSKAQFEALNAKVDKILSILSEAVVEEVSDEDDDIYEVKPEVKEVKETKKEKAPAKKSKSKKK